MNEFEQKGSGSERDCNENNHQPGGGRFGCGGIVIVIVIILLLYFIYDGASWDAIDTLLGFGLLTFLLVRWLGRTIL